MTVVANPVLPGFHPDPSIVRVGEWFYVANSTFEWWPAVRIHRSRDLAHWELAGHAVTRRSQLDLRGVPDSGGVWAPCLSYADGLFWLIYSDAKSLNSPAKDVRNYLITAPAVEGPWSEPVFLNRSGFDPSLFHDDDGRKWLVNQLWDPRPGRNAFAGIALQEYSVRERRLIGTPQNIFTGSSLGVTEGPHLYRRDGFYYLVTAEGGTGWNHAITVARSRAITGPYELSPHHPMLTARGTDSPLQKAGHGSFVRAANGRWFVAYLCSRPVGTKRRCILGRETALQPFDWPEGGWPHLPAGTAPDESFTIPDDVVATGYLARFTDDFAADQLNPHWSTLREPPDASWLSLQERPGFLRLRGRDSLHSTFDQSLVGFRLLHRDCRFRVTLDFSPTNFQQTAGLALYYNTGHSVYACVSADDAGRKILRVVSTERSHSTELLAPARSLAAGPVTLSIEITAGRARIAYAEGAAAERVVLEDLDITFLSDDAIIDSGTWAFTGTFAALCAQDSGADRPAADFSQFHYQTL